MISVLSFGFASLELVGVFTALVGQCGECFKF